MLDLRNKTISDDCPEEIRKLLKQIQRLQQGKDSQLLDSNYEQVAQLRDKEQQLFKELAKLLE